MRISKYDPCDTVNGPGIRLSIWPSGCTLRCPGCFNTGAQSFKNGEEATSSFFDKVLSDLGDPKISGISILGGHMFERPNFEPLFKLIKKVKSLYGDKKTVYVWTGYSLTTVKAMYPMVMAYIDVLIDGPFIAAQAGAFSLRGSANQRIYTDLSEYFPRDITADYP